MAFGLIGILGALVALVLFMSSSYLPYTQQVVSKGQSAQEQAEQMAGLDSQFGGRVTDHVSFEPVQRGGRLFGLAVRNVTPGSSYQAYYGIRAGDVIDQIGPQMVRDMDEEMAKALAIEAYQRRWDLGIHRGGRRFVLPAEMSAAAAVPAVQPLAPNVAPTGGALTPNVTPAQAQQPQQQPQPTAAAQDSDQPAQTPRRPEPYVSPLHRQLNAITNIRSEDGGE